MRITCAWCGKDMGEKDGKGKSGNTHGICEECLAKVQKEQEKAGNEDESSGS